MRANISLNAPDMASNDTKNVYNLISGDNSLVWLMDTAGNNNRILFNYAGEQTGIPRKWR
ncbi:MAG: hypothetical protein ACUVQ3_07640 [bacterium]